MTKGQTKEVEGWLIVDWKQETHRTRKNRPSAGELGTNELLAKLDIEVEVPEVDVPTLAAKIQVPEPHVFTATLDALDDEDMPGWADVVDDVVTDRADEIRRIDGRAEFEGLVDEMTTRALVSMSTRPDPTNVRERVRTVAQRVLDDAAGGD